MEHLTGMKPLFLFLNIEDVRQISFPSAGSALANVFLFTSIISYLLGLGFKSTKPRRSAKHGPAGANFDRELISPV